MKHPFIIRSLPATPAFFLEGFATLLRGRGRKADLTPTLGGSGSEPGVLSTLTPAPVLSAYVSMRFSLLIRELFGGGGHLF